MWEQNVISPPPHLHMLNYVHAQMAEPGPFSFSGSMSLGTKLEEKFLQNFISSRRGPAKKYRNKAGMKIDKKATLLWNYRYVYGGKERQEKKTTLHLLHIQQV